MKNTKNTKKVIAFAIIFTLAVLIIVRLMANHSIIETAKKEGSELLNIVSVDVATAKRQDASRNLTLVGTLSANSEITIAAQSQGQIINTDLELGQYKSKGSVIAVIDSRFKKFAVETARVNLEKQKKDLERYENLAKGGSVTQQQLDDARTTCANAKIQLDQAMEQLVDATVLSPSNGIIISKNVEKGSFVNVGTQIATIVDVLKLKIKTNVSETNVYNLKIGDKTTITTDVIPNAIFYGHISFISAQGDESHSYPVEIELTNNTKYQLKSGTFVNVHIDLPSHGPELVIPRESLQGSILDAKVYVVENGKAVLRKIAVDSGNASYLIVMSGLKEGDQVVTNGQINLTDGAQVSVTRN